MNTYGFVQIKSLTAQETTHSRTTKKWNDKYLHGNIFKHIYYLSHNSFLPYLSYHYLPYLCLTGTLHFFIIFESHETKCSINCLAASCQTFSRTDKHLWHLHTNIYVHITVWSQKDKKFESMADQPAISHVLQGSVSYTDGIFLDHDLFHVFFFTRISSIQFRMFHDMMNDKIHAKVGAHFYFKDNEVNRVWRNFMPNVFIIHISRIELTRWE